jgi:hypothetical protein
MVPSYHRSSPNGFDQKTDTRVPSSKTSLATTPLPSNRDGERIISNLLALLDCIDNSVIGLAGENKPLATPLATTRPPPGSYFASPPPSFRKGTSLASGNYVELLNKRKCDTLTLDARDLS